MPQSSHTCTLFISLQGKRLWVQNLPDAITTLELLDHRPRGVKGVLVALRNREVRVYRDKFLVNTIKTDVSSLLGDIMYAHNLCDTHTHIHGDTHPCM